MGHIRRVSSLRWYMFVGVDDASQPSGIVVVMEVDGDGVVQGQAILPCVLSGRPLLNTAYSTAQSSEVTRHFAACEIFLLVQHPKMTYFLSYSDNSTKHCTVQFKMTRRLPFRWATPSHSQHGDPRLPRYASKQVKHPYNDPF